MIWIWVFSEFGDIRVIEIILNCRVSKNANRKQFEIIWNWQRLKVRGPYCAIKIYTAVYMRFWNSLPKAMTHPKSYLIWLISSRNSTTKRLLCQHPKHSLNIHLIKMWQEKGFNDISRNKRLQVHIDF